ncbi:MAG: ABC-2 family transporter protein [Lactobacillus sp.]
MKWRIWKSIWTQSLESFSIYKTASFLTLLLAAVFFFIEILAGYVYFSPATQIGGWHRNDYLLLITTTSIITYIYNIFFINGHEELSEKILEGELDYLFVRPTSSYWLAITSTLDIPSIISLVIAICAQLWFIQSYALNWLTLGWYLLNILIGVCFLFVTNQIMVSISFWFDGFSALGGLMEDLLDLGTRPRQVFPRIIQLLFSFVLPILLITNLPTAVLMNRFKLFEVLYFAVFTGGLYLISRLVWSHGLRHYASAN